MVRKLLDTDRKPKISRIQVSHSNSSYRVSCDLIDVDKTLMKRRIILEILKVCGEALLFTLVAVIIVFMIGYLKHWDTSRRYSDAFFIAGCLVIIGGAMSRYAAGQEWGLFQRIEGEGSGSRNPGEQASQVVKMSSSFRLVFIGFLGGALLFCISALVTKLF